MKVINPDNSSHSIILIPRLYSLDASIDLEFYDETERTTESISTSTYTVLNGYLTLTFTDAEFSTITFYEDGKYQIKISDTSGIIYRGKMIASSQTEEEYKLTNGVYEYE